MGTRYTVGSPTPKTSTRAYFAISCCVEGHRSYTLRCNNWLRLNRSIKQGFHSHTFSAGLAQLVFGSWDKADVERTSCTDC